MIHCNKRHIFLYKVYLFVLSAHFLVLGSTGSGRNEAIIVELKEFFCFE